ncbi:MAG: peptide chain release factor N(5)-glutamine methyltransferase [Deltaproteobacteria bacterium]
MSSETWTVLKIIQWTTEYLKGKGIENPRLNSEVLLTHLLKLDRVGLYLNYDRPLSKEELSSFREIVKRRGAREPLQYITGHQEFWSLDFKVTPDVLIPRPETEILVEEAVKVIRGQWPGASESRSPIILDLCTGSGCIAISLAHELKDAVVYAVDASDAALLIARENSERHGVKDRVIFLSGDLYKAMENRPLTTDHRPLLFNFVVSNPPYVKSGDIPNIQPEVRDYEPRIAVDGGQEGLDFYKKIVSGALQYLLPGGCLMVEVGEGQAAAVSGMMRETGSFEPVSTVKDLAGIERVVKGNKV